ncbi:FitA-like ribbon-helix-helix domain-containing protein [Ruania zhangjianzhongii]|uniref:FitA-like ribbon-helix-helix domain-containing protein n=1 Tax=Ruania zhangjianzhongii TaxID=2603206 RepID=UPI003CC8160B
MLQVRNLPNELHAALKERARSERMTMSDYVTKVLQRDLAKPTLEGLDRQTATEQRASTGDRRRRRPGRSTRGV